MDTKFSDMDTNVENLWSEINDIKKQMKSNESKSNIGEKERELSFLQSALIEQRNEIKQEFVRLKDYSQRNNVLFFGVPEARGENCVQIVDEIIGTHMGLPGAWREIDKAHRFGSYQKTQRNARPIIVRFVSHSAKETTLSRSSGLRNTPFSVRPHLSEESQRASSVLHKAQRIGKETDNGCKVKGTKLIFKGRSFGIDNIESSGIPVHKIHQRESSNAIGFLGYLSPLSNFYHCDLVVNSVKYRSVEHFYQMRRAELCNEHKLVAKLHSLDTAREVKQTVNEFKRANPGKLALVEEDDLAVMKSGLVAKFCSGPLRTFLLSTGNKRIVECNAHDRFWSCGLHLDNPSVFSRASWKGKNNLGKLIEAVRSQVANENRE